MRKLLILLAAVCGCTPQMHVDLRINGKDSDQPPGIELKAGSEYNLTCFVINDGEKAIKGVSHNIAVGNATIQLELTGGDTNRNYILDIGEAWRFDGTRKANIGDHTIVATVSGSGITATDTAYYRGVKPSTIVSGYVWNDADADGEWDRYEKGMAGWTVMIGSVAAATDSTGKYYVDDIKPGAYAVSISPKQDWVCTYDGSTTINVIDGSSYIGRNGVAEKLNFGCTAGGGIDIVVLINGESASAEPGPTIFSGPAWVQCTLSSSDDVGKITMDGFAYKSGDTNSNGEMDSGESWVMLGQISAIIGPGKVPLNVTSSSGRSGRGYAYYVGKQVKPFNISPFPVDDWLSYNELVALMAKWASEMPGLTETFTYGKSTKGIDLCGIRVGNKTAPPILLHATIHGNEPRSTVATMWMLQKYMHDFGRDPKITKLLLSRDVYWVPAISPDSYLKSRWVDGVDPNRNFPYPGRINNPIPPIKAIMDLHIKHGFHGVLSGHTWGRVYFYNTIGPSKDKQIMLELGRRMGNISGYRTSQGGSSPAGYDHDWYYWYGACSFVVEFGSGRSTPPRVAIDEGKKNYGAYILFIDETPALSMKLTPPPHDKMYFYGDVIGDIDELDDE